MSFPKETMIELMSYADGDELDAESRARIEELLRTNEEARRVVDAMGALGEVVREGAEDRLGRSAGIADGVMAAIASGAGNTNVVPIGQARRSRAGATAAVVAALAVAAGVLFFVTNRAEAPAPLASAAPSTVREPVAPAVATEALAQAEPAQGIGVDLEEVRSIRNKVNVFFVPNAVSANATSSVVVWIDDHHGAQ